MTADGAIWDTLGLPSTRNSASIRRAYALRLRANRPEDDPAGFARLRAAYEAALAQADPPVGAPRPTVPGPSSPSGASSRLSTATAGVTPPITPAGQVIRVSVTTDLGGEVLTAPAGAIAASLGVASTHTPAGPQQALRTALNALAHALSEEDGDAPGRAALLQRVLDCARAGDVSLERDAEAALLRILSTRSVSTDALIDMCARHFRWEERENDVFTDELVLEALARSREARMLEELRCPDEDEPDRAVVARLSMPRSPLQRWWRAHFTLKGRRPELELLERYPQLIGELNAAEVAWWRAFAAGPKIDQSLLGLVLLLGLPATVLFAVVAMKMRDWHHLVWALMAPPAFLLVMLAKLYLIDWPAYLIARRLAPVSLAIQGGWLPMLLITAAASLPPGNSWLPPWVTNLLGVTGCLWAIYTSGPLSFLVTYRSLQGFMLGSVLVWWGAIVMAEIAEPYGPVPRSSFAGAAYVVFAAGWGIDGLHAAWLRFTQRQRRTCARLMILWGAGLVAILAAVTAREWQPLSVSGVAAFVLVHRMALEDPDRLPLRRMFVLPVCLMAAQIVRELTQHEVEAPAARVLGLGLVVSSLINLAVSYRHLTRRAS